MGQESTSPQGVENASEISILHSCVQKTAFPLSSGPKAGQPEVRTRAFITCKLSRKPNVKAAARSRLTFAFTT